MRALSCSASAHASGLGEGRQLVEQVVGEEGRSRAEVVALAGAGARPGREAWVVAITGQWGLPEPRQAHAPQVDP